MTRRCKQKHVAFQLFQLVRRSGMLLRMRGFGRNRDVFFWSGGLADVDASSQHADRCPNAATGHIGLCRHCGQRLPLLVEAPVRVSDLSLPFEPLHDSGGDGAS